jgi:hypothetical protein
MAAIKSWKTRRANSGAKAKSLTSSKRVGPHPGVTRAQRLANRIIRKLHPRMSDSALKRKYVRAAEGSPKWAGFGKSWGRRRNRPSAVKRRNAIMTRHRNEKPRAHGPGVPAKAKQMDMLHGGALDSRTAAKPEPRTGTARKRVIVARALKNARRRLRSAKREAGRIGKSADRLWAKKMRLAYEGKGSYSSADSARLARLQSKGDKINLTKTRGAVDYWRNEAARLRRRR